MCVLSYYVVESSAPKHHRSVATLRINIIIAAKSTPSSVAHHRNSSTKHQQNIIIVASLLESSTSIRMQSPPPTPSLSACSNKWAKARGPHVFARCGSIESNRSGPDDRCPSVAIIENGTEPRARTRQVHARMPVLCVFVCVCCALARERMRIRAPIIERCVDMTDRLGLCLFGVAWTSFSAARRHRCRRRRRRRRRRLVSVSSARSSFLPSTGEHVTYCGDCKHCLLSKEVHVYFVHGLKVHMEIECGTCDFREIAQNYE